VDVAPVREGLAVLVARVPRAGVVLDEADISRDGREVTLAVWSVQELSNWFDLVGSRSGAVSGRQERRSDGGLYGLGGLLWQVTLPELRELPGVRVRLWTESGEDEVLPDTALVRALCPWISVRAAASVVTA